VLRFVHAHADADDPCPRLRMSRLTRFAEFKDWVRAQVAAADDRDLDALCAQTLACDAGRPAEVRACAQYLRLLARHFLDADPYNAAKHGVALRGAAAQWTVSVEDWKLLDRDGATVSWLAMWRRDDPERPPRSTQVTRVFSVETTVALIDMAAKLMRALWLRARERHLDERLDQVLRPAPPDELFAVFDLAHPVIADVLRPLRYEGQEQTLIVRSRHFQPPGDDEDPGEDSA
jgi:hypothetical protein